MQKLITQVVFALCLSSCSLTDQFDGNEPLPIEASDELAALNVTLTTDTTPLPETLEVELIENSVPLSLRAENTFLHFVFSPRALYDADRSTGQFAFAFSQLVDDNYVLLRTFRFSDGGTQERFYIETNFVEPRPGTSTLPDVGDLVIEGQPVWIPLDATHVELRFMPNSSSSFDLVSRYDLNSFTAYRRYFKPFIERELGE